MERVLHVVSSMNRGGLENALMNYYRNVDRDKVQFDFLMAKQAASEFDDEILALGGRIFRIPMSNPLKYLASLRRFFKEHGEYRVMHVHHLPWGALTLPVAKSRGVKTRVSHVHFAKDTSRLVGLKQLMRGVARRFATHHFACGQYAGEYYFGSKICRGDGFRVLNNAIDASRFSFNIETRLRLRLSLGIGPGCLVIGQVGRLTPVKNGLFTIDVLSVLKQRLGDVKAIFVGDGPLLADLKEHAEQRGVADDCVFTGSVPNPQDFMQAMDVLIFPSLQEGLGMVAVEAQASGLPVVASTGVPRECNLTGLVTFLPLSDGPEAWAEPVQKLKDGERRSHVEEIRIAGYDVTCHARELQDFYLQQSAR